MSTETKETRMAAKKKTTTKRKPQLSEEEKKQAERRGDIGKVQRDLEKKFPGARLGFASDPNMRKYLEYGKMETPWPMLNALTNGGIPIGKPTTIFGPPGAGKTTMVLQQIAHWMQRNKYGDWIWADAENSWDEDYAAHLGVDPDRIYYIPGDRIMEDVLEMIIQLAQTGSFVGMVIDSLGGFAASQQVQKKPQSIGKDGKAKTIHDDTVAAVPKKISQYLTVSNMKFAKLEPEQRFAQLLIGHVYQNIDPTGRGSPFQEKGGTHLQHASHLKFFVRREYDKDNKGKVTMPDGRVKDVMLGYNGIIKIGKTKQSATEGHEIALPFQFGVGFDSDAATINSAFALGIISQGGAYYTHETFPLDSKEKHRIKGKDNAIQFLKENPEALAQIRLEIQQQTDFAEVSNEEIQAEASLQGHMHPVDPDAEVTEDEVPFG